MTDLVTQIDHEKLSCKMGEHVVGLLAQGYPIVYEDPEYPGQTIREYPDGHRVIIDIAADYTLVEVREIPPVDHMDPARIAQELAQHYWTNYLDPEYPGVIVREYPDGHRIVVHVDADDRRTEGHEIPPRKDRMCPAPDRAPA